MKKSKQPKLLSYSEYRLLEAYDDEENQEPSWPSETDQAPDAYVEPSETWLDNGPNTQWDEVQGTRRTNDYGMNYGEAPLAFPPDTGYYMKRAYPDSIEDEQNRATGVQANATPREMHYDSPGIENMVADSSGRITPSPNGPGPDEDPEDWQAKQDLAELANVYGLKLGSTKDGKLVVQKAGLNSFRQDFPDYTSAMQWAKQNMHHISKR